MALSASVTWNPAVIRWLLSHRRKSKVFRQLTPRGRNFTSLRSGGDLTIREVTKPATFDVTLKLEGGQLSGQAMTNFLMSDFGFGPISIAGVLNTEDKVAITFDFVARP